MWPDGSAASSPSRARWPLIAERGGNDATPLYSESSTYNAMPLSPTFLLHATHATQARNTTTTSPHHTTTLQSPASTTTARYSSYTTSRWKAVASRPLPGHAMPYLSNTVLPPPRHRGADKPGTAAEGVQKASRRMTNPNDRHHPRLSGPRGARMVRQGYWYSPRPRVAIRLLEQRHLR